MFGEDPLERENRALKQRTAAQDARLSVLESDVKKQEVQVKESTRIADFERDRANAEEERANKADAALREANHELAQLRLNVSNFETRLRIETDKSAGLERDLKRVEYDLECASSSAGSHSAADAKLVARVKAMEKELHRKESELAQARAVASRTTAIPSPAARGGRRRSSSMSSGQVSDLTSQLDAARGSSQAMSSQLDGVKAQLASASRERDKAVNEKMALEKKLKKETEELNDRIDDLTYELQSVGGGVPKPSKEAERTLRQLNEALVRATALEADVAAKEEEIARLQAGSQGSDEVDELKATIEDLEGQIASARPAAVGASHHLQRELKAALRRADAKEREIENLQLDLNDAQEEIEELRATNPGSGTGSDSRVKELEERLATLSEQQDAAAKEAETSEKALSLATTELAASKEDLQKEQQVVEQLRADLATATASAETSAADADTARAALASLETQLSQLSAEVEASREKITQIEESLVLTKEQLSTAVQNEDAANAVIQEKEAALAALEESHQSVVADLAALKQSTETLAGLQQEHADAQRQVQELQQQVEDLESKVRDSEDAVTQLASTRESLAASQDTVQAQRTELADLERSLNEELETAKADFKDKDSELRIVKEDLARALSDQKATQSRLLALEEELSSRMSGTNTPTVATFAAKTTEIDLLKAPEPVDDNRMSLMINKIQRLRQERNELSGQLSFVQHEQRFAIQAATEARDAANDALRTAQEDLARRSSEHDALVAQHDALAAEHQSLQGRAKALEDDTANTERLAEIEAQLLKVGCERDAMQQKLNDAECRVIELEDKVKLATADHESTVSQLQSSVEEEKEKRRRAEERIAELIVSSAGSESSESQKEYLQTLHGKIKRREQAIKALTAEAKKKDMNLSVAEESLKDLNEENDSLKKDLATAQAELETAQTAQRGAEGHTSALIKAKTARVAEIEQELNALQTTFDDIKSERDNLSEQLVAAVQERDALIVAAAETAGQIQKLVTASNNDIGNFVLALAVQSHTAAVATRRATTVSKAFKNAVAKVDTLEKERSTLLEQAAGADQTQQELHSTRQLLEEAETRSTLAENKVDELEASEERTRIELEGRVAAMECELQTRDERLSASDTEHEATVADLNRQLAEARKEADEQAAEYAARVAAAQNDIASWSSNLDELRVELSQAIQERDEARASVQTATEDLDASRSEVGKLQGALADVEAQLAEAFTAKEQSSARVEELAAELETAQENHAALQQELDQTVEAFEDFEKEHAAVRSELEAAQNLLSEKEEDVARIQAAHDTAQQENKQSSSRLVFMEKQHKDLLQRLAGVREQMTASEEQATAAQRSSDTKSADVERLEKQVTKLQQTVDELDEDLKRTMESLSSKVQEVEDADDKEADLRKNLSKVQKRADKLDRQNKALVKEIETMRTTMSQLSPAKEASASPAVPAKVAPVAVAQPATAFQSPARAAPSPARQVSFTPNPRVREFNAFEPPSASKHSPPTSQPGTPSQRSKRTREDDEETKLPTEVRVQPAPFSLGLSPAPQAARQPLSAARSLNAKTLGRRSIGDKATDKPKPGAYLTPAEKMYHDRLAAQKASPHPQSRATPKASPHPQSRPPLSRNVFAANPEGLRL